MAMTKCKECGKEISSSAKTCPNCGKDQRKFSLLRVLLLLSICIIGIYGMPIIYNTLLAQSHSYQEHDSNKVENNTPQKDPKKRAHLDIIKQVQPGKTLEYIKQYLGAPHEKDVIPLRDKNNNEKYQVNRLFYNLDNMNVMVGFIDEKVCYTSFEIKNYDKKFDIYPCGVDGYGVHLRLGESTFSNIIEYGSLISDDVGVNEPILTSPTGGNAFPSYLTGHFDFPNACNSGRYTYSFGTTDVNWFKINMHRFPGDSEPVPLKEFVKLSDAKDLKVTYVNIIGNQLGDYSAFLDDPPSNNFHSDCILHKEDPNDNINTSPNVAEVPDYLYTGKTNKFEIIVISAEVRNMVGVPFFSSQPAEGGVYLTVQWKYKNISGEPINFLSKPHINLIDPSGTEYNSDIGALAAFASEVSLDSKTISDLNPGITVKDGAVFEVAEERLKIDGWKLVISVDKKIEIPISWGQNN